MLSIDHPPQSLLSKLGDYLMIPIMYILQGNFSETPQRTHRWNNKKYFSTDISFLATEMLVTVEADNLASSRWLGLLPLFHIPVFGGWKKFVVLEPKVTQDEWYVGWIANDVIGISQIKLTDRVRVLRGPGVTQVFAINEHGQQIDLDVCGFGVVGKAAQFKKIPLL